MNAMIVSRYVCTEYEGDMEVSRIRVTYSLEEAREWLETWSQKQNERFYFDRVVNVNYQSLYATVIGEAPLIKIEKQESIL